MLGDCLEVALNQFPDLRLPSLDLGMSIFWTNMPRLISCFIKLKTNPFGLIVCRGSRGYDQPLDGVNQSLEVPFHLLVLRGHKIWAKGNEVVEPFGVGQDVDIAPGQVPQFLLYLLHLLLRTVILNEHLFQFLPRQSIGISET